MHAIWTLVSQRLVHSLFSNPTPTRPPHPAPMIQWTCTVCLKTFKRKGDFTRHSLIHQGNPYVSHDSLVRSITVLTIPRSAHRCEICGKSFYQFSGLKTHWNVQ